MPITRFSVGTADTGGSSMNPAPSGTLLAAHRSILICGTKPDTATFSDPTNWTKIGEKTGGTGTQGTDTGKGKIAAWYRDGVFSGGQSVSVTSGNSSWGVIVTYERDPTKIWAAPVYTTGDDTTGGGVTYSAVCAADPGWTSGDVMISGIFVPTDAQTGVTKPVASDYITATGIVIVTSASLSTPETNFGNDSGGFVADVTDVTGTALSAPTVKADFTAATNTYGPCIVIRLRQLTSTLNKNLFMCM